MAFANKSFGVSLKKFAVKSAKRMDTVVRKITLDLDSRIVMRTPVDKGRAQNNWNIAADNPDASITQEGIKDEQAVVMKAAAAVKDLKAGGKVFITNNLPYIERLEDGYSDQAANGMVAVTLNEYPNIVVKAAKESKRENP